uniref:Reverse transcriptase Ty1/copia-type domain-containing protein n=1 Tax=Cannabis sativa TaxID=3483 RepID=A0A803PXP7_CANSA
MVDNLVAALNTRFSLRDLGPLKYFLGIEVAYSEEGIHLCQQKYARDLLIKAQMLGSKPSPTPMTSGIRLSAQQGEPLANVQMYRSIVGALQYITITRHELSFSVNKVCQFMQQPLSTHWQAVKRILRYISGTMNHGLRFTKPVSHDLVAYCDADWASDPDDRKSTSGYAIFFGSNLIAWKSKKQQTVSRSKLHISLSQPPTIWCDNLSTIMLTQNPILHARTKHIELDLYFVREKVLQKLIQIKHVAAFDQIADGFTKAISSQRFSVFRDKLTIGTSPIMSLRGGVKDSNEDPNDG